MGLIEGSAPFSIIMKRSLVLLIINRFLGESLPLLPLLALYFSENGLSLSTLSIIFATLAVTVFVFEIPAGLLADRTSLKEVLVVSRILKLVAFITFYIASSVTGFALGAILWGLSSALDSGTFQGYLHQLLQTTKQTGDFANWYSHTMTASILGMLVSAGIATQVSWLGFESLQYIGIGALCVSILVTTALPKTARIIPFEVTSTNTKEYFISTAKSILISRSLLIILLIGVATGAIKGTFDDYTPLLLTSVGWSLTTVGYAVFLVYALQASGTYIGGFVQKNLNRQWLNVLICGLAFLGVGIIANPVLTLCLLGVIIVVDGILWVQNDSSLQELSTDQNRVTLASIKNFLTELCAFFILGLLWLFGDSTNLLTFYIYAGLALCIVAFIAKFKSIIKIPKAK
jgi:MFS family permease